MGVSVEARNTLIFTCLYEPLFKINEYWTLKVERLLVCGPCASCQGGLLHRVSYPHQKATEIDTKSQGERFTVIHYCKDNCLTFCVSSHRPSVFRNRVFHDYSCCEQKHLKSLNSIKWCAYGRGEKETLERKMFYMVKKGNNDHHGSLDQNTFQLDRSTRLLVMEQSSSSLFTLHYWLSPILNKVNRPSVTFPSKVTELSPIMTRETPQCFKWSALLSTVGQGLRSIIKNSIHIYLSKIREVREKKTFTRLKIWGMRRETP